MPTTVEPLTSRWEQPITISFSDFVFRKAATVPEYAPAQVEREAPTGNLFRVEPLEARVITRSTESLKAFIAQRMSDLSTVERVYSKYQDRVFYTWIVIEQRDTDVLRQIYDRELEVIERFADFGFDFYIIYRLGADVESLVSGDLELVFQK